MMKCFLNIDLSPPFILDFEYTNQLFLGTIY